MTGDSPHNPADPPALEEQVEPSLAIEADDTAMAGQLPLDFSVAEEIEEDVEAEVTDISAAKGGAAARNVKTKRHVNRARRRQMSFLEERRREKQRRVFYGRIKLVFKICFVVLWCILLGEIVRSPLWVMQGPNYQMSNNHLLQRGHVLSFVNRLSGTPLYAIDTGKLARQIESRFDILDSVQVRRKLFPARLEITVQEKQPWARMLSSEKSIKPYAMVAADDIVGLTEYNYHPELYPANLTTLLVSPRTVFRRDFLRQVETVSYQLQHLPGLTFQYLDLRNPDLIVAQFAETRLILGHLDNTASDRLSRVVPLIPKIQEFQKAMESVDMRWEQQITFHKKPGAVIKLSTEDEEEQH